MTCARLPILTITGYMECISNVILDIWDQAVVYWTSDVIHPYHWWSEGPILNMQCHPWYWLSRLVYILNSIILCTRPCTSQGCYNYGSHKTPGGRGGGGGLYPKNYAYFPWPPLKPDYCSNIGSLVPITDAVFVSQVHASCVSSIPKFRHGDSAEIINEN